MALDGASETTMNFFGSENRGYDEWSCYCGQRRLILLHKSSLESRHVEFARQRYRRPLQTTIRQASAYTTRGTKRIPLSKGLPERPPNSNNEDAD